MPIEARVAIVHDPSDGYRSLPQPRGSSDLREVDVVISIRSRADGVLIMAFRNGHSIRRTGPYWTDLEVSADAIIQAAGRLRTRWHDLLVNHEGTGEDDDSRLGTHPYADNVDLSPFSARVERLTHELAEDGRYLLAEVILGGHGDDLRSFREFLLDTLSGEESLRVNFDSDLHIPWPMLAVDLEEETPGSPWTRFLGHRHQLDHTAPPYQSVESVPTRRTLPVTSLNTDDQLQHIGRAPEIRTLLEQTSELTVRTQSWALLDAMSATVMDEDVMYFWCHGHFVDNGSPHPHLAVRLSDQQRIDAELVLRHRSRVRNSPGARFRPFVLINACHAGQPGVSADIQHLGAALVRMGADGVLGPQILMPQFFATEYAYAFLKAYLAGGSTAGEIAQHLARHFAKNFHNPLAIAYSLFCGSNSRLEYAA